jgi:crotonobetainyl-CoA:carnitine CoA-transferase CaiB-like acyl-CoA transferase
VAVSVEAAQLATLEACIDAAPDAAALAAWVASGAAQETADRLAAAGIAACVVQGGQDLAASAPWRDAIARTPDGALIKAMPFGLDSVPFAMRHDAPAVGQHTRTVLRDIAGCSEAEIAALLAAGVVECAPAD